jgi:hypothetical protein
MKGKNSELETNSRKKTIKTFMGTSTTVRRRTR